MTSPPTSSVHSSFTARLQQCSARRTSVCDHCTTIACCQCCLETCVQPTTTRPCLSHNDWAALATGQGMHTVQAMPVRASVSHWQHSIIHNRPTAACHHLWYSPAFSHMVRLAGTEDVADVWRARLQCSCSKGVEQPTSAHLYCRKHRHF